MRKMMFCAKRLDNGKWIVSNSIMQSSYNGVFLWLEGRWIEVNTSTVRQCTGKKDLKQKYIFEAHIIENEAGQRAVVYWHTTLCQYVAAFESKEEPKALTFPCRVIGNAFDHPELLKDPELHHRFAM